MFRVKLTRRTAIKKQPAASAGVQAPVAQEPGGVNEESEPSYDC
jgi:hypothetical protein